ncbi:hypothetical protein V8G54_024422, partial [Vigna mungo]
MFIIFLLFHKEPNSFVLKRTTQGFKVFKTASNTYVTTQFQRKRNYQSIESASKTIECPSLSLQRIHHVHGRNSLPPSVLGIGHSVANHILQEYLQHSSGLFIDQSTDPLHATSSRQSPYRRFRYALNVVPKNFPV